MLHPLMIHVRVRKQWLASQVRVLITETPGYLPYIPRTVLREHTGA